MNPPAGPGPATGDAILFFALAALVTFFALFTITRKNPVTAVMSLVAIVGGVVVSRSHQKEVAATRAAEYRHQIQELSLRDYPGESGGAGPTPSGGHH